VKSAPGRARSRGGEVRRVTPEREFIAAGEPGAGALSMRLGSRLSVNAGMTPIVRRCSGGELVTARRGRRVSEVLLAHLCWHETEQDTEA
jgi:hypothetical protein